MLVAWSVVSVCLMLLYIVIQWLNLRAWDKTPIVVPTSSSIITFSVLIAARNEADNIGQCLLSLRKQTYSSNLFEVIVIDDHSTDNTADLVRSFEEVRLLQLSKNITSKKQAIEIGVKSGQNEIVVTIDADCIANPSWLATLATVYSDANLQAVAAPVHIESKGDTLTSFQQLDFLGMMGVTASCHHYGWAALCNGANFSYRKQAFLEVNGFEGNEHIASGDDMFLMEKFQQAYPNQTRFLKTAVGVTTTQPVLSWNGLVRQRVRWAAKSTAFKSLKYWLLIASVGLFQASITLSFLLLPWTGLYGIVLFLFLLCTKAFVDGIFLKRLSVFFHLPFQLGQFFKALVIHIFYFPIIGMMSLLRPNTIWKGRSL